MNIPLVLIMAVVANTFKTNLITLWSNLFRSQDAGNHV